jgi:hypothetical protein
MEQEPIRGLFEGIPLSSLSYVPPAEVIKQDYSISTGGLSPAGTNYSNTDTFSLNNKYQIINQIMINSGTFYSGDGASWNGSSYSVVIKYRGVEILEFSQSATAKVTFYPIDSQIIDLNNPLILDSGETITIETTVTQQSHANNTSLSFNYTLLGFTQKY